VEEERPLLQVEEGKRLLLQVVEEKPLLRVEEERPLLQEVVKLPLAQGS
jgi:hypothetical protein